MPMRMRTFVLTHLFRTDLAALGFIAALIFSGAVASPASQGQRESWHRDSKEPIDLPGGSRVLFDTIPSEAIGRPGAFSVFLPPSYEKGSSRYPVVYFLHGLFNDETSWTIDRHGDIPALLDRLMSEGRLREMVLVHPDGARSFYTNYRDGSVRYEDFVVEELPAHIEEHYRVEPGRKHRAIAGTSMGGYGALKIAMRHPKRYAAVAAHSPIVFPTDDPLKLSDGARGSRQFQYLSGVFATIYGDPLDREYFAANNPLALAEKEDLDGLRIYFDYGTADRYDRRIGLGQGLRDLDTTLARKGVDHVFREHPGEPHGWALVYSHIAESLSFLAQHLGG